MKDKPRIKRTFSGYWGIWRTPHQSTYAVPVVADKTIKKAWDRYIKYQDVVF